MKTFRLSLALAGALFCASAARTQSLTIGFNPVTGQAPMNGYLPKVAGVTLYTDGSSLKAYGTAIVIYQTATGDAAFQVESANGDWNQCCPIFSWDPPPSYITSPTQPSHEVGHAPSIAMTPCGNACGPTPPYNTNIVQVHQGGQDNGSELWSRTAVGYNTPAWSAAQPYGNGYNPTVALDQGNPTGGVGMVVEVDQIGVDSSELWYHVGNWTATNPLTWGSAHDTGFSGYAPSVSIFAGEVILMAEGTSGNLWYSIGTMNPNNTITWGKQVPYVAGYNPSVSMQPCNNSYVCDWEVVEVHQANKSTGSLLYNVGYMSYTGFGFGTATKYSSGCYPSVAQMLGLQGNPTLVTEAHSAECGAASNVVMDVGLLNQQSR